MNAPERVSQQPAAAQAERPSRPKPAVVGIGASAGGVTALKTFFEHVPADSGLAFVVIIHLSPEHESYLAELLQPHANIRVQQVTETVPLEPDHVYVIPPGRNLSTIDTHLRLSDLEELRRERAPVDHFFSTLAATHGGCAIGVVLSGTGADGARGLKAIKEQGGLTVVQDPREAQYDGMPQSALATGLVDLVLPVAEIPEHLLHFARTQPRITVPEDREDLEGGKEERFLRQVYAQVRARTGRDFTPYKRSTIMRRIRRRMQLNRIEELESYLRLLREAPDEVRALADEFLITVTDFFRDTEAFQWLEKEVVPPLFADKGPADTVRVWSVGCATGEEAYSLAILLLEEAARHEAPPEIQIFASDLHEASLQLARQGFYPGGIETVVSLERLHRFFIKEAGGYRVRKEVRERVVFTPHNLLGDPPFSRLDLVACRNILIYLQREAQRKVIELFHYALKPDGFLVLGSSESVEDSELFRAHSKHHRVFQKRNVPPPEPRLPVFPLMRGRFPGEPKQAEPGGGPVAYESLYQRMVERHGPPCLLVNPEHKVVYLSERAGRYLVPSGGAFTTSIFKQVREELRVELRAALHAAKDKGEATRSRPIPIQIEGAPRKIILDVRPAKEPQQEGFALVTFDELEASDPPGLGGGPGQGEHDATVRELETELEVSRQRLQGVIEEYETSQEEMKAANEEMQSANEELRSMMEELETSREELQSMNEELATMNQENRQKVEELAELSNDLQNLLASTEIATLFLDQRLHILRFTPRVGELFNVRPADRGRPLSDFTHRLGYRDLLSDAQRVLDTDEPVEREVQDEAHRWYITRVLPYRGAENRIQGVVITFVEITARKQAEDALRESAVRYRNLVDSSPQAIFLHRDDRIVMVNPAAVRLFSASGPEQLLGKSPFDLFHPSYHPLMQECISTTVEGEPMPFVEVPALGLNGTPVEVEVACSRFVDAQGAAIQVVLRDIAERKERLRSELLSTVSHELRTPLTSIAGALGLLQGGALGELPAQVADMIAIAHRNSRRLTILVNDLLDMDKLASGRMPFKLQPVELKPLITEALTTIAPYAETFGVRLAAAEVAPDIVVQADPDRLLQVLANLLSNAVKFSPRGEAVEVRATCGEDAVRVAVIDRGPGVPASFRSHIFQKFAQADVSDSKAKGGTGLGLSIAKAIIEQLGGRIGFESEVGQGATFWLELPAAALR